MSREDRRAAQRRCRLRAEKQAGVLGRDQAIDLGLTPHQIDQALRTGQLLRLLPATYSYPGSPGTTERRLWSVQVWLRDRGAFSHRTAGHLWRLPGIPTDQIDVTVRRWVPPPRDWIVVHQSNHLSGSQVRVGPHLVTTVSRTLRDLAAVVSEETLEIALDHALVRELVIPDRLIRELEASRGRGRRGCGILLPLVRLRTLGPPCASPLETKSFRFLRRFKFPPAERQFKIFDQLGFVARADFAYPRKRLVLEADSVEWHARRDRWEEDREKYNRLARSGWSIGHILANRLRDDPEGLARELRALYDRLPDVYSDELL